MAVYNTSNEAYDNGEGLTETSLITLKDGTVVDPNNRFPVDIDTSTPLNVNIGTMPDVTINQPVAVTDNGGSLTVDGSVSVSNFPAIQTVEVEPFNLRVSKGLVSGHTFVHKFGAVPNMHTNTTGTVWDKDDTLYPWSEFNTAGTVTVRRGSASDNGKEITIQGLDASYNPVSETITISASTNTGSTNFIRVNRAFVSSGTENNAEVQIEKNGTDVAIIQTGRAQTLMAVYTVPAGKTGYLMQVNMSISAKDAVTGDMYVRYFGENAFRIGHTFEVSGDGGEYDRELSFPIPLPEKTDIDVRLTTRSNNVRATTSFDIMLVDNA